MAKTLLLAPRQVAAFTAGAVAGALERLTDQPSRGTNLATETVPAGVTVYKGPYQTQTRWSMPDTFTHEVTAANDVAVVDGRVNLDAGVTVHQGGTVRYFDDFFQKALDETNENWILNAGNDDLAADPAIVIAAGGTVFLDAGDGDGSVAADGSQLVFAIPVTADKGGLYCEARVALEALTCSVNVGFTDVTTLEEPFSIATATLTSNATDAVCFTFDNGATLKTWHRSGVNDDTDATGNGSTGIGPTAGTFQVLRIEIDADGEGAEFFIDGVSAGRLTASVVKPDVALYFTAIIVGDGANAAAVGLTVDYVEIGHIR